MGVTSCHHCHILLVKSESYSSILPLPILQGRGLNQGVNTRGKGFLKIILRVCPFQSHPFRIQTTFTPPKSFKRFIPMEYLLKVKNVNLI